MEPANQHIVNTRITAYLTQKVKETFPDDYPLIESQLPALTERYALKELLLIVRIQVEQIKRSRAARKK